MINTIFYYPTSLTFLEYTNMLSGGEISGRTIVFAAAQKAIYKGGLLYGISDLGDLKTQIMELLGDTNIIDKLEELIHDYYTTELIDNSQVTTKIEQLIEQYYIDNPQDLPKSSKSAYGVVKIGEGINVSNGVISVTLTKGDKGDTGEKGEKGDKGDTGATGPQGPTYNDQEVRDLISQNRSNLQSLLNSFDQRVTDKVTALLSTSELIQLTIPEGTVQRYVDEYLNGIGFWTTDENDQIITKFAEIEHSLQTIRSTVASLTLNPNTGGGTALTAELLTQIAKIAGLETAVASMSTQWAQFESGEDGKLKILRWLASALDLYTNENATWANLASAANNKTTSQSAIAALQTRVASVENGLISDARLTTLVQNKVNDVIGTSGFVSTSALSDALQPYATSASMFAAVGDIQSDVDSAIASINVCARYETEVVNGERVPKNYGTSGNPKYRMESAASIYADLIDISAAHKLTISAADQIDISSSALNAILGNFTVQAENVDFSAYNISLDAQNGEMWLGGGVGNYRAIVSPTEISVGMEGYNLSWVNYVKLDATSGSVIAKSNQGNGPWSEMGSWGFAHHSAAAPGTVFSVDDSGNLECTQLHAWGDAVVGGNLSSNSNISATNDITAGGDITADGDMTADNIYIRNNGSVTVRTGGSISTPSITIGSSNDNSTLSYNSVDSIVDVNTGMCLDGDLQADNIWLANNGGITIGSDSGFTGTLALGGGTLTFKGGILISTTLSTV